SSLLSRFDTIASSATGLSMNNSGSSDVNPFIVDQPTFDTARPQSGVQGVTTPIFRLHSSQSLRHHFNLNSTAAWMSPMEMSSDTDMETPTRTTGYERSSRMTRLGLGLGTRPGLGTLPADEGLGLDIEHEGDDRQNYGVETFSLDTDFGSEGTLEPHQESMTHHHLSEGERGRNSMNDDTPYRHYDQNNPMSVMPPQRPIFTNIPESPSITTPTPINVPGYFLPPMRSMASTGHSTGHDFSTVADLRRRVADVGRRTFSSLNDLIRDEDELEEGGSVHNDRAAGADSRTSFPATSSATTSTAVSAVPVTVESNYPSNPFLTNLSRGHHAGRSAQQLMEEDRFDVYRDEDIGMELNRIGSFGSLQIRRRNGPGEVQVDPDRQLEARLDPDYLKALLAKTLEEQEELSSESQSDSEQSTTSDIIEELRHENCMELTTPDELERRSWMYEESRINKVQRLGHWQ
ncbi:hypothetical protein BG004_007990, partial [Podila humilis]